MKRALGAVLLGIATCVAATGCNLLLGNEEHELAREDAAGGTGGLGSGGTAGQGGAAGQGGSAAAGGTAGAGTAGAGTGGAGGSSGAGGAGGTGGTGGTSGGGGTAGVSGAGGLGGIAGQGGAAGAGGIIIRDASTDDDGSAGSVNRDSSSGGAAGGDGGPDGPDGTMQDGTADAADACTPNSTECRGRSVYLCTTGGAWVEILQCPAACVTGACTGSCVPGTAQCMGNTPQTCDAGGQWQSGSVCPYVCTQGACAGMCVPGNTITCGDAMTCNAGASQTCDTTGTLGPCLPAPSNCAAVPMGWDPVAFGVGAGGTCPSGFDLNWPQTMYTSATGAPYTCTCGCSGTQACEGTVTLNEALSCASSVLGARSLYVTPNCMQTGNVGNIYQNYGYSLSDVAFAPSPACFANPTPINPTPVQTTTVTLCTANQTCPTGACLSPSQTASMCVMKYGMEVCPQGYPSKTTLAAWYDDTRSCGACACGSTLSCILDSVLVDNGACTAGPNYFLFATTSCSASGFNFPINNVKANATITGDANCVETAPSNPMGGVQLNQGSIATVCCK